MLSQRNHLYYVETLFFFFFFKSKKPLCRDLLHRRHCHFGVFIHTLKYKHIEEDEDNTDGGCSENLL